MALLTDVEYRSTYLHYVSHTIWKLFVYVLYKCNTKIIIIPEKKCGSQVHKTENGTGEKEVF